MSVSREQATRAVLGVRHGKAGAVDELFRYTYDELRKLASRCLRRERPQHTLQTTALVHEAYLKLVDQRQVEWTDEVHFRAVAALAIRRILLDYARRSGASKRGGGGRRVPLEDVDDLLAEAPEELIPLDEAVSRLEEFDARKAEVVRLRFFGNLSIEEAAEALGVSHGTVERDWKTARAWLQAELAADEADGA